MIDLIVLPGRYRVRVGKEKWHGACTLDVEATDKKCWRTGAATMTRADDEGGRSG